MPIDPAKIAKWMRHYGSEMPAREVYERLRVLGADDEAEHRRTNVILASYGIPVRFPRKLRPLVVVEVMRTWLPRIRSGRNDVAGMIKLALHDAADLIGEPALKRIRVSRKDVAHLTEVKKRGARNAAAYLMLRTGACGFDHLRCPEQEDIDEAVAALKKRENERKNKVKRVITGT